MLRRTLPSRVFNATTVGSTIGAFKCLRFEPSLSDLADPEGNPLQGTLWVHEKTQTQVFFFSAKEASSSSSSGSSTTTTSAAAGEKACSISFCTPPENDSGATHILEHTVLCGSEKFPEVRDPFFKMLRRSLSTFMNAMTSPDSTFFPFSTVNEQDFFNILDVYLDCTLHPLIRPLDFAQEAHRLKVLSSNNDDDDKSTSSSNKLERTGVVLNEMKGALSDPMTWFQTCLFNHCHAGSAYSRCFGGAPPAIPDLEHEDLIRYYGRHYQRPVVAIYDSAITSADAKKQFLETSLKKILTEVEKPRQVLQQQQQSGNKSATTSRTEDDSSSPLQMLANLRQTKFQDLSANTTTSDASSGTTSIPSSIMNRKYAFSWGPPDPVASSLEEQNLSTARIGFFLPLENIISNKNIASRDDHKEMFKLQLALHILLRPPSGPLYKALLLNPQNVKAMQSENIQDVMKRTSQLTEQLKTGKFDDTEGQEQEQQQQQQESSTIDLIPGSGFDHSAQVPALFIGLQNVPTAIASETDCSTMCLAKSELLAAIIQSCLSELSLHGINQDLVESAVHEFELALRVRDKMSAVNSTINSTSAVMRGLDPFFTHSATDIDKEISSDLLKSTTTTTSSSTVSDGKDVDIANTTTNNVYFTRLIQEQILNSELFEVNQRLTAVVGSSKFVQQQSAEEKKNLEELSSQISKEEVEKAKKLDEDLLQAQKKTDDGGSLPTLTVADISPSPINFTNPSFEDKHIQTYVTNTAGLVYCRFMFPIPEEFCVGNENLENLNNNNNTVLLPLFSTLFSQLGHLNKSISEQDIAIRKVCSGFEAAFNIISLPENQDDSSSIRPNLRAVQVSFHCMPENLEKSLQLLQECIESNCNGLWTDKLVNDPERKAMLFQLITMIAGGMESQITQAGTQYATCEALMAGLVSGSSSTSSSTLNSYATWSGMSLVRQVSQIKEKITELSSSGKDPSEAVSFLFPAFENLARSLFSFNPNTFSYVICGPQDQEKVKQTISEKFLSSVPNLLSSPGDSSALLLNQKRLIINDDPSLHAIMMRKDEKSSSPRDITRIDLPNSDGSSFVGCVLPTTLSLRHELSPAFRVALQIASQEFLHREIREIGGAYGSMARLGLGHLAGVSGIASFGSYRDPSPKRTIEILRDGAIYDWFKQNSGANGLLDKRMLQEAKLSIFGAIDAPMVPHEVADRYAVCKYDYETFATYRKRLLDASLDDVVRSVEEHLKPEDTKKMMSVCVLGGLKEEEK